MEKKKIINKSKLCALITLTCFFIANVCGQFAYASVNFNGAAEVIRSSDSFIPFSSGKISYAKNFGSKDIIVNIQDLHCHGETQRNIAAILKSFEKYGFDKIYLEGAVENVSTQNFISLRETDLGKLVIEDLVDNGALSGAEYYSVKAGKADIIKPLDKSGPYFENIMLLGSILDGQDLLAGDIKGLKNDIEAIKKNYYNADLLRLDNNTRKFSQGKIPAKKYYLLLSKLSDKASININAYSNIEKYINLIGGKGIDYQKVSDELKVFVNVLKENIPYGVYNELSRKSSDFSNVNEIMPVLMALSDKYGICGTYKLNHLNTFFTYLKNNEELNLLNFITEEDRLIYDIGISLSQTKYEREVVFLDRFVKVLEDFFTAKITSGDYKYYLNNYARFEETANKYLGADNIYLQALKKNVALFDTYHKNNIKRDNIFISLLSCSDERLSSGNASANDFSELKSIMDALKNGANIKIVITGGFHSEGLKKHLAESKTSLVIVTPNVTGDIERADNIYSSSISEYYQVFTSAINKMPASADPLQIALPKIIGSTINRARINQIPLKEAQDLINSVFSEEKSIASISDTPSQYEHVIGAEVRIGSVNLATADFTVVYDYDYGKYSANYIYDFKTKVISLIVDNKKVKDMYDSFFYNGEEGYSAPLSLIKYGEYISEAAASLINELSSAAGEALLLLESENLHSSIVTNASLYKIKKSPMQRALPEPASDEDFIHAKNMIGKAFFETKPFKAKLSGNFKLMSDGVIIYQIDNPLIRENFSAMRNDIQSGDFWSAPQIVHITIGRLVPGKYSQRTVDKISAIIDKYNNDNPFKDIEYTFNKALFGTFDAQGGNEIRTEEIKFGDAEASAGYAENIIPEITVNNINEGLKQGLSQADIEKQIEDTLNESVSSGEIRGKYAELQKIDLKIDTINNDIFEFTVKYVFKAGGFTEFKYKYETAGRLLYKTVDDIKVKNEIAPFFTDGKERFSDATLIINNMSIAGNLKGFYEELRSILPPDQAHLLSPQYYHFSISANSRVWEPGSFTLDHLIGQKTLNEIRDTIPDEIYDELKDFKERLEGYFFLTSSGAIVYRVTNQKIIDKVNKARSLLKNEDGWTQRKFLQFTVGRLFPEKNTQEDIDKINALLDRYNENNPLSDIEYTFNNIIFGQLAATGNGFVDITQINPQAPKDIAAELVHFDNASLSVLENGHYFQAGGVDEMLIAIENIAALNMSRYEFTFDALVPDNYAGKSADEIRDFRRKFISPEELYGGIKNIRDYLIANADIIKKKAAANRVSLSMHSYSVTSRAFDKNGKEISVNPHPGFNDQMRDMFDWQLEIAEALGVDNITVHLENYDTDGYAEFVRKAAKKKIKINFENHLAHSSLETNNSVDFYYATLIEGFMPKEEFIKTMLDIKSRLSTEEQKYLGVTFDTSKVLNSYLQNLPVDAGFEEKNAELEKVTLENLIDYYEAVENAGLTINNIHLAQFRADSAYFKERKSETSGQNKLIVYNKSTITDLNNPYLDMAAFLRYLRDKNYKGALHQETRVLVSPLITGESDLKMSLLRAVSAFFDKPLKLFSRLFNILKSKSLASSLNEKKALKIVIDNIAEGTDSWKSVVDIQKKANEALKKSFVMTKGLSGAVSVTGAEVSIHFAEPELSEFRIKYVNSDGSFTEIMYKYDFFEKKVVRAIDDNRTMDMIEKFFYIDDDGALREKYSEPVIVVNNKSIAGNLYEIYEELNELLPEEKAFFRRPEFYHFSFSANKSVFPEGSKEITLNSILDKTKLRDIETSIPREVYEAIKSIKGKLDGYFYLSPDGTIIYKVTNDDIVRAFSEARGMLDYDENWEAPSGVHFSLGRLLPGENTQEDIDAINAILDKYNKKNPLRNIEYSFSNVMFGQFTSTGNGFANVIQINPQAKKDIAVELSYFDNATRLTYIGDEDTDISDEKSFSEAEGAEDMLNAIEHIALFGLSRYEFTFDALLPEYYAGKSEKEKNEFKKKLISSDELYKGTKNIRDYLLKNADRIKQKAAENNIDISMHAFSIVSNAKDENGEDTPVNPHPGFNDEMREIFDWQLEIAKALGVKNITVHLEDNDIDGYVKFVQKAAQKDIRINFENHIRHSDNDKKTPDAFFFFTMVGGYMDSATFVQTMLAIKNELSEEEQKYLGVTFDTSKALNSYLKTLPLNASFASINREFAKVTLENLIKYYEAIVNAGLTINNIHLAQLSANIDNIKKRGPTPDDMHLIVYNKSIIDGLTNPSLDMLEFLRYLRKNNYRGALHQETRGIVRPAPAEDSRAGGFIGEYSAPVIFGAKENDNDSEKTDFSVMAISGSQSDLSMDISGRFADMSAALKSMLDELLKQNENKKFRKIMNALIKASDRKSAGKINFFEIESAYTNDNGYTENITDKVGGFSSNRYDLRHEGIIALRKELFGNSLAFFHEFVHWALADGAIKVESLEAAVTDQKIREKFILGEPFDEETVRKESEEKRGENRYIEVEDFGAYDGVESDVAYAKTQYDSKRAHGAIRAFQAQYLPDMDADLSSLIKSSSKEYLYASLSENEEAQEASKKDLLSRLANIFNFVASEKEAKEAADAAAEEVLRSKEDGGAEEVKKDIVKKVKYTVKKKPVKLYDQLSVYGSAKRKGQTTLVLDKDALSRLNYAPGGKVYITSFPDGRIFLFVQTEALKHFADKIYEKYGVDDDEISRFVWRLPLNEHPYPFTMEAVIDENGVLKINLSKNEINTFIRAAGNETDFTVIGKEHGVVAITGKEKYARDFLKEHDHSLRDFKDGARLVEEIIRSTQSSIFFTHDRIDVALRFLNSDQRHITILLKPVLEDMLKESDLNKDQKAFAVLVLAAISAVENPDFEYIKRQIKNAGAINADSLITWLEMINNSQAEPFFAQIIDYIQGSAVISKYSENLANALGSLTIEKELKNVLVTLSENERWLLETERNESPGKHMLYGKIFVEAEMLEKNIDFKRLEILKDFGIKPLAISFGDKRMRNKQNAVFYVNIATGGKILNFEISLKQENGIPVILMTPLFEYEDGMDYSEIYSKAAAETLIVLRNDYTAKGKFAYFTGGISLFERVVNFISRESLFRMIGKRYDFDLKAFSFDKSEVASFGQGIAEIFPDAVDIKKNSFTDKPAADDVEYHDISSNILKTKDMIVNVLKRLVLKDKESESMAGIIVGERIDSKIFSMLGTEHSPLASYGINGLAPYCEKRMRQFGSPIILLEDISLREFPMTADAALIDWTSVQTVKNMISENKISEESLKIYENDLEAVRNKSLALAETVLKEISEEAKSQFNKFVEDKSFLGNFDEVSQFAQFVLITQLKDNLERIHNANGKVILTLNISDNMTNSEIIRTAAFWQNIGFDGIRLNIDSQKTLSDASLFANLSSQMRSAKSDSILMIGLPSVLSDSDTKNFAAKAAELDIISAVGVSKLSDALAQYKQKIWADINPLNEEYSSDASKYFDDIRKAIAFGAGYLGIAAGTNIINSDGKSVHIEIMDKITEMLSSGRTVTRDQAYMQGYRTGLQSKDELKSGFATRKLIVQELVNMQKGKALKQGMEIDAETLQRFKDFIKAEPGLANLRFIKNALSDNNEYGIYGAAGYLRGIIESSLLAEFREKNGFDDSSRSELLRKLLLLDFSMPEDIEVNKANYSASVQKIAENLSDMRPDEMLQKMLEDNYGAKESKAFVDYAVYIYMLKNNGATVNEIINNVDILMKSHLSEVNFGYGVPVNEEIQAYNEKLALGEIIEMLCLGEQKPVINKSVKDAVNGSVNTLAVSMLLKAA